MQVLGLHSCTGSAIRQRASRSAPSPQRACAVQFAAPILCAFAMRMMSLSTASAQRLASAPAQASASRVAISGCRRRSVHAAAEPAKGEASTSAPAAPAAAPPGSEPVYTRTFRSLGSEVIESNKDFEEPPANDLWEGEQFEAFGQLLERWFLPGLVVLGVLCGAFAASTYNEDADTFIKPAAGPDESPTVMPASAFTSGLSVVPAPEP